MFLSQINNRLDGTPRVAISNFLLLCFVFYQFGISYHLSFGSLGLFILFLIFRKNSSEKILFMIGIVCLSIAVSFFMNIARYGDEVNYLRVLRFLFNSVALFYLINLKNKLRLPSATFLALVVFSLLSFCLYQAFIDINLRTPAAWFALSAEIDGDVVDERAMSLLRVSGPYTEPSVLGLIFSCLLAISLKLKNKIGLIISGFCALGVVISGSLLGLIGLVAIVAISLYEGNVKKSGVLAFVCVFIIFLVVLFFFNENNFALLDRSYSEGGAVDDSTMTRVFYPFVLIFLNFMNWDIFGYPGDIYSHFLFTGLYDSLGNFPGHNGFLGLIMAFGLFGIMIIVFLKSFIKNWEELFLIILIGSQSGNFLSYEKVFAMLYVLMVIRGSLVVKNNVD